MTALSAGTSRSSCSSKIDEVLFEGVFEPELAGNLGLEGGERDLVLQRVAHTQAVDRDMLLVNVRVHGRFARHIGGHVLNVVIGRRDDRAVGLDDADVGDVDLLIQGRVGEGEHGHVLTPASDWMRTRAVV